MTVTDTILKQMNTNPNKVYAMIGGQCLGMENGLQINFKGSKKANKVQIILEANDTYTMRFYKYNSRTFDCPVVGEFDFLYWDALKETFERFTGLYLSL